MSDHVRRIGYICVSPSDRNPGVQTDALALSGCDSIHQSTVSENPPAGEALRELLDLLGDNDTLIAYCLDRLGRDAHRVRNFQQQLEAMGVELVTADNQETTGGSHE